MRSGSTWRDDDSSSSRASRAASGEDGSAGKRWDLAAQSTSTQRCSDGHCGTMYRHGKSRRRSAAAKSSAAPFLRAGRSPAVSALAGSVQKDHQWQPDWRVDCFFARRGQLTVGQGKAGRIDKAVRGKALGQVFRVHAKKCSRSRTWLYCRAMWTWMGVAVAAAMLLLLTGSLWRRTARRQRPDELAAPSEHDSASGEAVPTSGADGDAGGKSAADDGEEATADDATGDADGEDDGATDLAMVGVRFCTAVTGRSSLVRFSRTAF